MKTSIIILTKNNLNLTKSCVKSIEKHTDNFELIFVDNCSTDGTVEYIQTLSDAKCIINQENVEFANGCNKGITQATGNYILFLNNDTIVTKGWLTTMIAVLEQDPRIAMVGPVSSNVSGVQRVPAISSLTLNENTGESEKENFFYSHRLDGFCLLAKRSVLDEIGGFDEQFTIGSCESDDLCYRVLEHGYRLAVAKNVYIHHVGHSIFTTNDSNQIKIQNENLKKLKSKWQINYFPYLDARVRLNAFINTLPDTSLKILDVGCGIGALGLELLNRNKGVELWGIEDNPLLTKLCSPYYEKVLKEEDLATLNEYFDLIIIQSSADINETNIQNAVQWKKGLSQASGPLGLADSSKVHLYLADITYEYALPIIKPADSPNVEYLQKVRELFSPEEFDLDTTLKKTIKPVEESILSLSRLITDIESCGLSGEVVSEWTLESSEDYAKYQASFDKIFQYDLVIEILNKGESQLPMEIEEPAQDKSYV